MENIRLVIWDLDNTFWDGTLTEGGINYSNERHEIVIELARRGIMSSICSNNDLENVKSLLIQKGIWEYFIFPNIEWGPKGQRIQGLISDVQLRPETILFIDDNHMNLAEVTHYNPGIQVVNDKFITEMLNDARLKGKDDVGLARLAQYKVLENRKQDEIKAGSNNEEFLRSSQIYLTIDYDLESNIERAIELINRTNQLNFTKKRLSEDPEAAKRELTSLLQNYDTYAGLIHAKDKYGEYGYIGIFVITGSRAKGAIEHFCFSCRTLNMGIETWVYRWIGSPQLSVPSDVLCDVVNDQRKIDWIEFGYKSDGFSKQNKEPSIENIIMRGGCDLAAISHYLADLTKSINIEHHKLRDNRAIRIDHSQFLGLASKKLSEDEERTLQSIGYVKEDHKSEIFNGMRTSKEVWVLSFLVDSFVNLYKNKNNGLLVPFSLPNDPHVTANIINLTDEYLEKFITNNSALKSQIKILKEEFEFYGLSNENTFEPILQNVINAAGQNTKIFILMGPEKWNKPNDSSVQIREREVMINEWIMKKVGRLPNVTLIKFDEFIDPKNSRVDPLHFDRITYLGIAEKIKKEIESYFSN